ncbi:MAG TPA: DUF3829 domain-containing protein [Telluria sp.]
MKTPSLRRLASHAAVLLPCALLLACSPAQAPASADEDQPPPAAGPLADAGTRSEAWKLDRMISCFSLADERARAVVARYLGWIGDRRNGPTGIERRVLGIEELPAAIVDRCSDEMHLANTGGPPMRELDGAARVYLAALRDLSMQILPLHRYYRRATYKDDGFAQGRALHGKVMEAARHFSRASDAFSLVLDRENERHLLDELAGLQDGATRYAGYYRLALAFDGRRLVRLLETDRFDAGEAQRQIDAFERIARSARAMQASDGSPVRELRFVNDKALAFLEAAKARALQAGGHKAGQDELLRAYHDMVEGISESR